MVWDERGGRREKRRDLGNQRSRGVRGAAAAARRTAPTGGPVAGHRGGAAHLSGLGLGYAVMRHWLAMVVCWVATGILLLIALPADPDGVSGSVLTAYLIVLGFAAVHGAFCALRTRPAWPPRSSVAVLLGLAPGGAGQRLARTAA